MGAVGRLLATGAALAGVAVFGPAVAARPGIAPVAVRAVGRCPTGHLRAVARIEGAAAGTTQVTLRVTDIASPCALTGYGHYQLLDRHHRPLETNAGQGHNSLVDDPGVHRVILGHGASAYALVAYHQPNVPGHPTLSDFSHFLRCAPPSAVHSLTVPLTIDPDDHGRLDVTALVHGGRRPWANLR